tara:strand:- start:705 stop:923 length:219 start_codon:yes stop_codon:yes gene_type:complete
MQDNEAIATWNDIIDVIERRHSTMVRLVLEQVEATIPDGRQQTMFKKHVQVPIYDFKTDLMEILSVVRSDTE